MKLDHVTEIPRQCIKKSKEKQQKNNLFFDFYPQWNFVSKNISPDSLSTVNFRLISASLPDL